MLGPVCAREFSKNPAKKVEKNLTSISNVPSALIFVQECKHLICTSLEQECKHLLC